MLAIIARPYDANLETLLIGPPYPLGVEPLGPDLNFSIFGGEVARYLAEGTYITEPGDTVPGETFPLDVTIYAPPVPLGMAPLGPALSYGAHFPAALFPSAEAAENIYFEPRLKQSLNFEVRLWEGDEPAGRSRPGVGVIEIANPPEGPDGVGDYDADMRKGWDGRRLRVYEGDKALPFSTWQLRAILLGESVEWTQGLLTLGIKDPQARLDRPLQHLLYAGTGSGEGGADIKGRPKPVCLGWCENVPAVLVDNVHLVYQVSFRGVENIAAVRDKGVILTAGTNRADFAALIGAIVAPGAYDTCLALGLFRLGASPAGKVTADVAGDTGMSGGDYVETTAGLVRRIATQLLDDDSFDDPGEIDSDAFTLLEAQQPATVGYFTAEPVTAAAVLDALMLAIGSVWGVSLQGQLTVSRLQVPAGTPADTLANRDLGATLRRQGPIPSWRRRIGWRPMFAVQSADELADSVSDSNRALYSEPYRYAVAETVLARTTHKRAREVTVPGFFAAEADAATEAARQQEMFGAQRSIYTVPVNRGPFDNQLGSVIALENLGRFGIADAQAFRLIGLAVDRARGSVVYELWG